MNEFECPRCGHCCPEREWVGLTDGEMVDLLKEYEGRLWVDVCRVIEAKLKEKNT
jgi:Fe-S-cluster containining protein